MNYELRIIKYGKRRKEAGFSLFIAVIVMGALLLVAFAISNLAAKEVSFSSLNKESQYAFFAADAGIECALYWDTKPVTGSAFDPAPSPGSSIDCAGTHITDGDALMGTSTVTTTLIGGGGANTQSIFSFSLNSGLNPTQACAIVTVTKNADGSTDIYSRGYNNCTVSDPRRVERGIQVKY
jgi:hypothetical protein